MGVCQQISLSSCMAGAAWLAIGAAAAGQGQVAFEIESPSANSRFGRVAWVGDLDGDGFDEFIVGAQNEGVDLDGDGKVRNNEREVGVARLYSGANVGTPLRTWTGDATLSNFGAEAWRLGDLDGDGHAEFAVAATSIGRSRHDYLRIYSGNLLRDPTAPESLGDIVDAADRNGNGTADGDEGDFAAAACDAGDVDRDGHDDVLVAGGSGYHWVILVSGKTLATLFTWDVHPTVARAPQHSTAVASFRRDVTGDGQIDFAFGNFAAANGAADEAGEVAIYSGRNPIALQVHRGSAHHDWFGYSLAIVPDVSGDSSQLPELVIGAPGTFTNDFGAAENGNYVVTVLGEDLANVVQRLDGTTIGAGPGSFFGAFPDAGDFELESGAPQVELFVPARHESNKRGRIGCFGFDASVPGWSPKWSLAGTADGQKFGRVAAGGRLTRDVADPTRADAGDDLLIGSGHWSGDGLTEDGRAWCLTTADGATATTTLHGDAWAGDGTDPSLLPTIAVAAPPVLGTVARVDVGCPLAPSTFGLLLIGLDALDDPALPHLLVDAYAWLPFQLLGGAATLELEIPNDPAWFATGPIYHAQALFSVPSLPGRIAYSQRVEALLGGRSW